MPAVAHFALPPPSAFSMASPSSPTTLYHNNNNEISIGTIHKAREGRRRRRKNLHTGGTGVVFMC